MAFEILKHNLSQEKHSLFKCICTRIHQLTYHIQLLKTISLNTCGGYSVTLPGKTASSLLATLSVTNA